jgi:heme o synthase
MVNWINIFLELTKSRISLLVTFSAVAGFVLSKQGVTKEIVPLILGVFLLACGACVLNQYQERKLDGLMERTKNRPLPAGRLNPSSALWISVILIVSGSLTLFFGAKGWAFGLGLFATLWYNGVYTYLKRKTTFAVLPGGLIGAVPPVMGWVSGGGNLLDPRIGAIAFFFFLWQVPHFWLLLMDFPGDHEKAGLPTLASMFSAEQLKGMIFIWILSTGVASLQLPLFLHVNFLFTLLILIAVTFWLSGIAMRLFKSCPRPGSLRYAFVKLNVYAVCVISLISLDRLLYKTIY